MSLGNCEWLYEMRGVSRFLYLFDPEADPASLFGTPPRGPSHISRGDAAGCFLPLTDSDLA